jgi:outer membrane protein TolC
MTLKSGIRSVGETRTGGACLIWAGLFLPVTLLAQSAATHGSFELSLQDYLSRVLERNESIQQRQLEVEVARRKYRGEYGAFEPELFGSFTRESNKRQNTVEQQQTTPTGSGVFNELNNIYQGGLQALVASGARVQLGYSLRDLKNNIQPLFSFPQTNDQFQSFFGLTVTQPLLKNAWDSANLAGIRLAALGSDMAFQDYRRQLMIIISTAEALYWNLYLAQEQVRFFQESVATADKILADNRARALSGKSSELEVLEAEAGLALRHSKLSEAEGKLYEAANRVISLYSETVLSTNRLVRAVDRPQITDRQLGYFDIWQSAYELNPDYLSQRQRLIQESVRVGYALNQILPELNLKGSYGLNGLGDTPGHSWDQLETGDFPSWSVGVELHIPLGGGIKNRNELAAARLRREEAVLALKEIETQIANSLDTALHKIRTAKESIQSYQKSIQFNTNLLESALARLDVGRLESRKVFEIEAELFEARNAEIESLVNYQRALLELELVEGSILKRRKVELSQKELRTKTAEFMSGKRANGSGYPRMAKALEAESGKAPTRPIAPPPIDSPPQQTITRPAAPLVEPRPVSPTSSKEQRLAELLRKYKADEIGSEEYHIERAKILAEP